MNAQPNDMPASGQLFVVATPIGHLDDISLRAIATLREVDLIAAEDTRTSRKLCRRHGIATPMTSLHEHNEDRALRDLLTKLESGMRIALISDAGTPLISDPGFPLVREARRRGIPVVPVPGPCSPIAALSASGLPTDRFTFQGFLPRSGRARKARLAAITSADITQILLESPHRLARTLDDLIAACGADREACLAREITKLHETFITGTLDEIRRRIADGVRGEIVLIVAPASASGSDHEPDDAAIRQRLNAPDALALPPSARARLVAAELGVSRRRVYALITQESREAER